MPSEPFLGYRYCMYMSLVFFREHAIPCGLIDLSTKALPACSQQSTLGSTLCDSMVRWCLKSSTLIKNRLLSCYDLVFRCLPFLSPTNKVSTHNCPLLISANPGPHSSAILPISHPPVAVTTVVSRCLLLLSRCTIRPDRPLARPLVLYSSCEATLSDKLTCVLTLQLFF